MDWSAKLHENVIFLHDAASGVAGGGIRKKRLTAFETENGLALRIILLQDRFVSMPKDRRLTSIVRKRSTTGLGNSLPTRVTNWVFVVSSSG